LTYPHHQNSPWKFFPSVSGTKRPLTAFLFVAALRMAWMMIWSKSVEVVFNPTREIRVISNLHDAAQCLLHRWPAKTGKAYSKARTACLSALEGHVPAYYAREAFVAAATEANILRSA
jgi:hypothetical protein